MYSEFLSSDITKGSVCEEMLLDGLSRNLTVILNADGEKISIENGVEIPEGNILIKANELILESGAVINANLTCSGKIINQGAKINGELIENMEIKENGFEKQEQDDSLKEKNEACNAILKNVPLATDSHFSISPDNAVSASQREGAVVTKDGSFTIVGTDSAGPCYIVGLYNDGVAAVFHIDGSEELSRLSQTIVEMQKGKASPVEMHLRGGEAPNTLIKILGKIQPMLEDGSVKIASAEVMTGKTASLAIDAKTGATAPVSFRQMNTIHQITTMTRDELYMMNQPIRMAYDGRKEIQVPSSSPIQPAEKKASNAFSHANRKDF
jgi:hypothetical protein